jgi:hypothetical protein
MAGRVSHSHLLPTALLLNHGVATPAPSAVLLPISSDVSLSKRPKPGKHCGVPHSHSGYVSAVTF